MVCLGVHPLRHVHTSGHAIGAAGGPRLIPRQDLVSTEHVGDHLVRGTGLLVCRVDEVAHQGQQAGQPGKFRQRGRAERVPSPCGVQVGQRGSEDSGEDGQDVRGELWEPPPQLPHQRGEHQAERVVLA